jgi:hypothetical protein
MDTKEAVPGSVQVKSDRQERNNQQGTRKTKDEASSTNRQAKTKETQRQLKHMAFIEKSLRLAKLDTEGTQSQRRGITNRK